MFNTTVFTLGLPFGFFGAGILVLIYALIEKGDVFKTEAIKLKVSLNLMVMGAGIKYLFS